MQKALTILAVIIVFGVTSASACRPLLDPNTTLADELGTSLKYADAVFIGTVDRYEYQTGIPDKELDEYKTTRPDFTWKAKVAVFRIDQWWKGSVGSELAVVTNETIQSDGVGRLGTSCDAWFEIGKTYLVFTNKRDGYFRVPVNFGLTREMERAKEVLPLLGPGKKPMRDTPK